MEPHGATPGQVTLDFYLLADDGLIAGHANRAGPGTVPCRPAVFLWEYASDDPLPDTVTHIIGVAHGVPSSFTHVVQAGSLMTDGPSDGRRVEFIS